MKKNIIISVITALTMLLVPSLTFLYLTGNAREVPSEDESSIKELSFETISVFSTDENKTMTLDFRDYIIGVVAAEMPAQFHSEALSAGAVAAATLARKKIISGEQEALQGAVISTDPKKHQAYMTKEEMKERWGKDFDKYYKKIADAVDNSIDYSITSEGELINAVYHAISPGKTENAQNIWEGEYPYLVSVESTGDRLSPKYLSEESFTITEFCNILKDSGAKNISEDITFEDAVYSDAGTLLSIKINKNVFTGEALRELFSLRSAAITPKAEKDKVIFTVKGYGHGVGLSQYGADYLARQGYSWQEIIKHYYTGVEITLFR